VNDYGEQKEAAGMESQKEREERLLAKIRASEKIESVEEMTEEYREALIHLMTMQADSELSGALGYVPWIAKAPGIEEKLAVATIVRDEIRHATVMYRLLRNLGVDVDERVKQLDYAWRIAEGDANLGTKRIGQDLRVNIFYYPIETWADFILFNFCMDRGAGHQLEDVNESSYGPWARAIQQIFKEEQMHVGHGEAWMKRLAEDPATKEETQAALDKWYPRTMNIFGRPGTAKNQLYRKLGLKQRDNDEVRQAFVAEVKSLVEEWGLKLPPWTPEWEQLSEEAAIPG